MKQIETPVLIVGGGGAGLTASMLLSVRQRQITAQGAVLVRPDRFVAWRSAGASHGPARALRAALSQVLCRPLD